jgi:hypothetical protein
VLDEPSALPAPADEAVTQPVETPAPQTMGDKVETR